MGEPGVISIHAPLRGRPNCGITAHPSNLFQSTPPCGGDSMGSPSVPADADFNPRPLAGATADADVVDCLRGISIHAPLRGRLVVLLQDGLLFPISIHAPLRGRREHPLHFFYKGKFQSTPPCGGDFGFHGSPSHELTFQSTPPCGGDTGKNFISASAGRFQSTPPCGGDHGCILFTVAYSYFNPRPLAGATRNVLSG